MSGLMPREHGAYAQLGYPLLTGLIYSGGDPGAVAFTVAAVALFLAHEPLAILTGVRGARLQTELRESARRRLLFLTGAALGGLIAAIGLAPPRAWMGAVLPAGLGLLLLPLIGTKKMKSIPAEVIAATVFATAVVPLALSGETPFLEAGLAAAVWLAATVPAIFAVHAMKAALRKRPEERWLLRAAPVVGVVSVAAVVAGALAVPGGEDLLAALPPALASLGVAITTPHPRHLKRVGWLMVAANTAALTLLLVL
jgi:hypothetical protein